MRTWFRSTVCGGASLALTLALLPAASQGQTALPQVNVEAAKKKPPKRAAIRRPPTPLPVQQATVTPEVSPAQAVADKNAVFDQ